MSGTVVDKGVRSARMDVDHPVIARTAVWGTIGLAAVAWAVAAPGLIAVGRWAGLPGIAACGVPLVIDAGMALMMISGMVQRARGERASLMTMGTVALALLSVAAQVVHGLSVGTAHGTARLVAVALSASLPLIVLLGVESAARLLVSQPVRRVVRRSPAVAPSSGQNNLTSEPKKVSESTLGTPTGTSPSPRPTDGKDEQPKATAPTPAPGSDRDTEIARLSATGLSHGQIAAQVGVSKSTVTRTLQRLATPEREEEQAA